MTFGRHLQKPSQPVLLIGAGGMLGHAWQRIMTDNRIRFDAPARTELDLADDVSIRERVTFGYGMVVNCAGYTNVDKAELEPELAYRLNAEATRQLAERCARLDIPLVHYSTDYVFDGCASQPYSVNHPMNPAGVYGRSKAEGERFVRASGCPYRFSMHYYLLCHFLAAHGIDPLKEVTIEEVAPPQMPYYLEKGWVDGIFAPEPFNQICVNRGTGFIFILSKDIWQGHPCCCFATSDKFARKYPNAHRAALLSVLQAEYALHQAGPERRKQIAREISAQPYLNQNDPTPVEQALAGDYPDGRGNHLRPSGGNYLNSSSKLSMVLKHSRSLLFPRRFPTRDSSRCL